MNRLTSLRIIILALDSLLSNSESVLLPLSGRDASFHHKQLFFQVHMNQIPTWRTLSWLLDNDEWVAISSVSKIMRDNIRDLESTKQQSSLKIGTCC